ncbi:MAG: prolipoprotein diacylglyceryl transferase [Actinomycetes bacterium]
MTVDTPGSVEVTSFTCRGLDHAEPQSLGITYWFDAAPDGDPYPVNVHVSGGRRGGPEGDGAATFTRIVTVDRVVPGSGRVAVTTRVPGLSPGTWDVTVTPVQRAPEGSGGRWVPAADPRLPRGSASGRTGFAPVIRVRAPGARLWAWPALVTAGAVLGVTAQGLLAWQVGLPVQRLLLLTITASLLGLLGAKAYYLLTHPRELRSVLTSGMSVQGFVIVVLGLLVTGSLALGLPWRAVLDVSAPGLLLGMTVGRLGCLLGGCCAGRPTASRWGMWLSDRRLGMRRIPVQLLESALAAVSGAGALIAVLVLGTSGDGLVFVAALAAYVAGRQVLFPLRDTPRLTAHGRSVTLALAVLTALGAVAALALR